MAAVLTPRTETAPWNEPAPRPSRPQLRLLEGGLTETVPCPTPAAAVGRRPLVALVGGVAVAVLVALAAVGAVGLLGADAAASGPASTATTPHPTGADATTTSSAPVVVVQPGDTLWAIARRLRPSGDIRPLVDELAARAGGAAVDAGQRIDLTGLLD
jgi:hypothetical protein